MGMQWKPQSNPLQSQVARSSRWSQGVAGGLAAGEKSPAALGAGEHPAPAAGAVAAGWAGASVARRAAGRARAKSRARARQQVLFTAISFLGSSIPSKSAVEAPGRHERSAVGRRPLAPGRPAARMRAVDA